jgi:putative inorganic carbon (hco3(-)) transporter
MNASSVEGVGRKHLSGILPGDLLPVGLAALGLALGLLVARAPLVPLLLGLGGVIVLAGTFMEPLFGLGVALWLGPLRAWLEIRSPGIAPHVGQAVLVLVLVAWVAQGILRRKVSFAIPAGLAPLLVFIAVALLSLWSPVSEWHGALELLKWMQVALVAILVHDRLRTGTVDSRSADSRRADSRWAVALLGASAAFQALIGLWQFGLLRLGPLTPIEIKEFAISERFSRAYGSFQQPNPFAGFLGLVGALLVGITLSLLVDRWRTQGLRAGLRAAVWPGAPALLVVAGLVASWSRGGWMGFAAAMLAIAVMLPRRGWWGPVLLAGLLALGGLLLMTGRVPAPLVDRLMGFLAYTRFEDVRGVAVTDATFAVIERMAHWQAALGMWRDHFWVGIGWGGYETAYPTYRLIRWALPLGHAHNTYLNLLAETGLLGLCAYLGWLGIVGVRLLHTLSRPETLKDPWRRALTLGLVGAWTHFVVHSFVDSLMVNNVHLHVGVLLALSLWVSRPGALPGPRLHVTAGPDAGEGDVIGTVMGLPATGESPAKL